MATHLGGGAGAGAGAQGAADLSDDDPYGGAAAAALARDDRGSGANLGAGAGAGAGADAHGPPQPHALAAPRGVAGEGAGVGLGGPAAPAHMDFAAAAAFVAVTATDASDVVGKWATHCLKRTSEEPHWCNNVAVVRVSPDGTIELVRAHPGVAIQLQQAFARKDIQDQFVAVRDSCAATNVCKTLSDVQRMLISAKSSLIGGNAMKDKVFPGWPASVDYGKGPSKYSWEDAITVTQFIDSRAPSLISDPLRVAVKQKAKSIKRKAPLSDGVDEGGAKD